MTDLDDIFGEGESEAKVELKDDKGYTKRVAFVISAQHFIPHGGIGSFAKSFSDMAEELGWAVDYILDKAPDQHDLTTYIKARHRVYYIGKQERIFQTYGEHARTFVFGDSMHLERMVNFRSAMMRALEHNLYDMVIINSVDAVSPIYYMNLHEHIPVVYYTHSENLIFLDLPHNSVFTKSAVDYMKHLMTLPGITMGTQSAENVKTMKGFNPDQVVFDLPMRIPEINLLEEYDIEKEGVMFIGRFEPRKQPKLFADIIKKTGLKAKILTNSIGEQKFIEYFKEIGYDNYEIKYGIIGEEKVKFIKSAKMGFHTSNLESYGFCVLETLTTGHTFCLEEYSWWRNFEGHVLTTTKKKAHKDIIEVYNKDWDEKKTLKTFKKLQKTIAGKWEEFLEEQTNVEPSKAMTQVLELIVDKGPVALSTVYFDLLKRDSLALMDIFSVYKKRSELKITHYKNKTEIQLKES